MNLKEILYGKVVLKVKIRCEGKICTTSDIFLGIIFLNNVNCNFDKRSTKIAFRQKANHVNNLHQVLMTRAITHGKPLVEASQV
jgi:hypothetical protein